MSDILVISDITFTEKLRLTRLAMHLRQIDVAHKAGKGVTVSDVVNLEKHRVHIVPRWKVQEICKVLGVEMAEVWPQ